MKTFQVPVWFNVTADNHDEAWEIVIAEMNKLNPITDVAWEWVVEEPVETSEDN